MNYEQWKSKVDQLFLQKTGVNWENLCGEEEVLQRWYHENDTPEEFVNYWIEKHDLEVIG